MKNLFYIILLLFCCNTLSAQQSKSVMNYSDTQDKFIKFYPNPASTTINFELLKLVDINNVLQIYNFTGKKVFESSNLQSKISIELDDFYRGIYIFQLRDKSGRITESGKFQVIK